MSGNRLLVRVHDRDAGFLHREARDSFVFEYLDGYDGPPVSLTMPVKSEPYRFREFPPFFDGLLPEGWQLEALLRQAKLDRHDYMGQLALVGEDSIGAVSVVPAERPERDD